MEVGRGGGGEAADSLGNAVLPVDLRGHGLRLLGGDGDLPVHGLGQHHRQLPRAVPAETEEHSISTSFNLPSYII